MKKYKTVIIIFSIVIIFISIAGVAAVYYPRKNAGTGTAGKSGTKAQLTKSLLDGMSYSSDLANRNPLAVSVENHPSARPQYGLSQASIVYEAITEGGITRYIAIFAPKDAKEIGPIRSARLFFMDWLVEYGAFFAHAGGNEDALANISAYKIKDLNDSRTYFWRDSKGRAVASEHTLFSSTEKLYQYAQSKDFDINKSSFDALKFKTEGPAATAGKGVEINFSSAQYKVRWSYDQKTNSYLRFLAGKEDRDALTNAQLSSKNVIIQEVARTLQPTGNYGGENWVMTTAGSGKAHIFRDGQVLEATWKKPSRDSRTKFYDANSVEITFNPGTFWYEIIPPGSTYVPI